MLLANWPLPEFAKFLQLMSWIIMPFLLLAVIFTAFLHYYQAWKKKKQASELNDRLFISSPENQASNGTRIFLDHTGLIRHFEDKIGYHQARYTALQNDFRDLETKYSAVIEQDPSKLLQLQKINMEETNHQNANLQPDLLQQQVNEQILLVHGLLKQRDELDQDLQAMSRLREEAEKELASTRVEIGRQDLVISELRYEVGEKENQLYEKKSEMNELERQLTYHQKLGSEIKQQNEQLQTELDNCYEHLHGLQEQLNLEEMRVVRAMQELQEHKIVLKNIYLEAGDHMRKEETQVIELKTAFVNTESQPG